MTKIKICGLMSAADAELMNRLRPDCVGIVMFFEKSHRSRTPDEARAILAALDRRIRAAAVTVSPTVEQLKAIEACGFDIIQIHGDISDEVYAAAGIPIFKAFNVHDTDKFAELNGLGKIKGFVFDAAQPGSGKTFDWSAVKALPPTDKDIILAGGLTPENVRAAIEYLHPDAVDVSSGVENSAKTGKDPTRARAFVNAVRETA